MEVGRASLRVRSSRVRSPVTSSCQSLIRIVPATPLHSTQHSNCKLLSYQQWLWHSKKTLQKTLRFCVKPIVLLGINEYYREELKTSLYLSKHYKGLYCDFLSFQCQIISLIKTTIKTSDKIRNKISEIKKKIRNNKTYIDENVSLTTVYWLQIGS